MKSYVAYIRVSTVKQGEHGSSLLEQKDAILHFASRHSLRIVRWFEERETAAKVGRREFTRMLAALKKGEAEGVIFHKIDRSARNLRDWSVIQDLADEGIDVRFTQESISLESNEGKLTGDFLAAIAAHYIRNLREEVKKGIRGRLKQGLYPLPAPLGYLDQGGGKPKIPDPARAPFVRDAFALYGAGGYSLHTLSDELYRRGLRSKSGNKVGISRLSGLLRNPFYAGVIRMKRSGDTYSGIHEPIVAKTTFDRVQLVLAGKLNARSVRHDFLYRRMLSCAHCTFHLIGERQRGRHYYRCHTEGCPTLTVREEPVEATIRSTLQPLQFEEGEIAELRGMAAALKSENAKNTDELARAVELKREALESRFSRLTDAYIDGAIERSAFGEKKLSLLIERKSLEAERRRIEGDHQAIAEDIKEFLERLKELRWSYEMATIAEKRELLRILTSNMMVDGKNVAVTLRSPFKEIANVTVVPTGAPLRRDARTRAREVFDVLLRHFSAAP